MWLSFLTKQLPQDQKDRSSLEVYGCLTGVALIFVLARTFILLSCFLRCSERLHDKMVVAILKAPVMFFDSNPVGTLDGLDTIRTRGRQSDFVEEFYRWVYYNYLNKEDSVPRVCQPVSNRGYSKVFATWILLVVCLKKRLTSKSTQVSPPCSYHLWKRVGIKCTKSSEIFPSAYFGRNKCDVSVINGRFFGPLEVKWTK